MKRHVLRRRSLFLAWGICVPGCLVSLHGACTESQLLSVCVQVQQPWLALLGSLILALPAQLLSVCAQVQQPLIAWLGSMALALPAQLLSVCVQVQQPLLALSGFTLLALPAQLLSVCAQVQQPLIALLGSMVLALPAQLLCLPLSLSLLIHCVGKANMAGAAPVAQTLVSTCSNCHNPNLLAWCYKSQL